MKGRIRTISFSLTAFVFLSGSADIVNYGNGRYLLKISEDTPIEKDKLESIWLKKAKSICNNSEFSFAYDDAKVDDSKVLTFDRKTKSSYEKSFPLRVELGGAFKCN